MTYRKAHNLVPSTKRLYQLVDILRVLNLVRRPSPAPLHRH